MDRRTYIGGSDAAAIMGMTPYDSVLQRFNYKIGRSRDGFDPDAMHIMRGNIMEPIIMAYLDHRSLDGINKRSDWEKYHNPTDMSTIYQQIFVYDSKLKAGGHTDGIDDRYVYEAKAPAMRNLRMQRQHGVNSYWLVQLQHYMMITGHEKGMLAIWDYDNWSPWCIIVNSDPKVVREMRKRYKSFWKCVTEEMIDPKLFERYQWRPHIDSELIDSYLQQYLTANSRQYYWSDLQKSTKGRIMTLLAERDGFTTDRYVVTVEKRSRGDTHYKILKVVER